MTDTDRDRYRACIADWLEVDRDRVTLFAKGRVALFALLRALDIGPGSEVIVPAFTCVAVPNAILYAGARPVWIDIDPVTGTIEPEAVRAAVTPRTRAVLAQNTFGLSADLDGLLDVAGRAGIALVDDCAHGLGGQYRGRPNGSVAPVAFFSTQWSKPVSTGLGGFAVARDADLAGRMRELEAQAAEPSAVSVLVLRALVAARGAAGDGRLLGAGRELYRALGRRDVVPGSSRQDELDGTVMPPRFLTRLSDAQARLGASGMRRLDADVQRRQAIARRYSSWLADRGRTPAAEPSDRVHAFLRYPLRVSDQRTFAAAAAAEGIDVGNWFVSPVHPIRDGLERWGYVAGSAPCAEAVCREIVNLPTSPAMADGDVERIIGLLGRHLGIIR